MASSAIFNPINSLHLEQNGSYAILKANLSTKVGDSASLDIPPPKIYNHLWQCINSIQCGHHTKLRGYELKNIIILSYYISKCYTWYCQNLVYRFCIKKLTKSGGRGNCFPRFPLTNHWIYIKVHWYWSVHKVEDMLRLISLKCLLKLSSDEYIGTDSIFGLSILKLLESLSVMLHDML